MRLQCSESGLPDISDFQRVLKFLYLIPIKTLAIPQSCVLFDIVEGQTFRKEGTQSLQSMSDKLDRIVGLPGNMGKAIILQNDPHFIFITSL